jgi:hypothetical protein
MSSLCQCSLASKHLMPLARYHLFNDITLELCEGYEADYPSQCGCGKCINQFSRLLSARKTTIPRSIRTLTLNGTEFRAIGRVNNLWYFVEYAGGMECPQFIRTIMKHFTSVVHLEMRKLIWFTPPRRSSRTIARFFSSVKSLTLDGVIFYGGPKAIFWMLDKTSNLDVLRVRELDWPSRDVMPNDPPGLLVFAINLQFVCNSVGFPLRKLLWGVDVTEKFRTPMNRYTLHKPLLNLVIDVKDREADDTWLIWLLAQAERLNSVTTFHVSSNCFTEQEQVDVIQRLLDGMASLKQLTLSLTALPGSILDPAKMPPTLVAQQSLEYLEIRCHSYNPEEFRRWISWLWVILHTVTSPHLAAIRLVMDMICDAYPGTLFTRVVRDRVVRSLDIMLGDIDNYLCSIPSLRQLSIDVGTNTEGMSQWLKEAFWRCDAKDILNVKWFRGSIKHRYDMW